MCDDTSLLRVAKGAYDFHERDPALDSTRGADGSIRSIIKRKAGM